MSVGINLELSVKGHNIIRKECPNCGAEFVFRVADKKVRSTW
jgi:predicted RNA-binding Zn-ribbon protein involved in translation (DUF1610 family)